MEYYLGIDQGGTKTYAAVCTDDGNIIGAAKGKPSIFYIDDIENQATAHAKTAAEQALKHTGIDISQISAVCGALTGADWDFEFPIHSQRIKDGLGISDVLVINDCIAAMRGGSNAPNRGIICAGTGLNAAVRGYDGRELVFGYYIKSCDNGAASLGSAALEAVFAADIGLGAKTALTDVVLAHTGYDSAHKLFVDLTVRRFSLDAKEFTIGLLQTANAGDPVAIQIIDRFAISASNYIKVAVEKLKLQDQEIDVVFSGSVFKNYGNLIMARIVEELKQTKVAYNYVPARYEPVCGALLTLLDRKYCGSIPQEILDRFDEGCIEHNLLRSSHCY